MLRDRYPEVTEQAPIEPIFETFGGPASAAVPQIQFQSLMSLPMPRYWFEAPNGDLFQVQRDRIVHNWRKLQTSQEYPRYEQVRAAFLKDIKIFSTFLRDRDLGEIRTNQSEISYINIMALPDGTDPYAAAGRMIRAWQAPVINGEFEDAFLRARFVLREDGQPIARLHVTAQPALVTATQARVIRMELTVRGKPSDDGLDSALQLLDKGREAIVRTFAELTTPEMHAYWGRKT